jgi:septation ring formation regulator
MKSQAVTYMQNGQVEEMKAWKVKVEQELEDIYKALEQEVENRKFVERQLLQLEETQQELTNRFMELKKEVANFKMAYSWDQEWEAKYSELDHHFKSTQRIAELLRQNNNHNAGHYAQVKPDLDRYLHLYEQLVNGIENLSSNIQTCRSEELKAKEELQQLKRQLTKVKSELRKSNIPGLPGHVQSGLALAEEAVGELRQSLESTPLDMHRVQHQLKQARNQVHSIAQVASTVMEMARKAEIYIQYGNRFRSQDEQIRAILEDAEQAFRDWQYQEALELAEEALDRADKNWRNLDLIQEKTYL